MKTSSQRSWKLETTAREAKVDRSVQVNTTDTRELIRLTEALQELAAKLDRIGGIVVKQYQMTERLDAAIQNTRLREGQSIIDDSVVQWINRKIAKKMRKKMEKRQRKKDKKKKHL